MSRSRPMPSTPAAFRSAMHRLLPHAGAVIAATLLAAGTPEPLQAQSPLDPPVMREAEAQGVTIPRNTALPEARPSGKPAVRAVLDLTTNALYFRDRDGFDTYAPRSLAEVQRLPLSVRGSEEARYGGVSGLRLRALRAEPTRVMLSRNTPETDRAIVVLYRGAPGDPTGYPEYTQAEVEEVLVETGGQGGVVVRRARTGYETASPAPTEAAQETSAPSRAGQVADEAKQVPGRILENTTRGAIYQIEGVLSDRANRSVYGTIDKILRRP